MLRSLILTYCKELQSNMAIESPYLILQEFQANAADIVSTAVAW